jgi:hypothetical protein
VGLSVRFRIPLGRRLRLNLSRRGMSLSGRAGPLTGNTRGGISARLGRGLTWRGRWRR